MSIQEALSLSLAGSTLIRDSLDAPGAFVLLQLLRAALKQGTQVVLLLAKEPLSHYQYILRKQGVSLTDAIASGQVAVTDMVTEPDAVPGTLAELQAHLQARVQQAARAPGASAGVALHVDSLTELHSLYCDSEPNAWLRFLMALASLDWLAQAQVGFAAVAHEDAEGDAHWTGFLEHMVQDAVRVEALEAGPSQEVTGRLHVAHRWREPQTDAGQQAAVPSPRQSCLYKLTEVSVRAVQTEQNVL